MIYASRLLGYYRVPELQTIAAQEKACSDGEVGQGKAPEADLFLKWLRRAESNTDDKTTTLRVATGDNFAPFLLSREMFEGKIDRDSQGQPVPDPNGKLVHKESYTKAPTGEWVENDDVNMKNNYPAWYRQMQLGDSPVSIDNVACFLRLMRFDAVVPGIEDFYFGPSRLQFLAKYLSMPKDDLHQTRMLGVNLYLKTRELASATSQSASESTPRPTANPPVIAGSQLKITTPKNVLPWMRSVRIRNWLPDSQVCIVEVDELLKRLTVATRRPHKTAGDITVADEASICVQPEFSLTVPPALDSAKAANPTATIRNTKVLNWDTDYAVAVVTTRVLGQQLAAWQPFTVVPPFFGYKRVDIVDKDLKPEIAKPIDRTVAFDDRPWFIRRSKAANNPPEGRRETTEETRSRRDLGVESVAVFGVVDPNLIQSIGR